MNEDRIRDALRRLNELPTGSELPVNTATRARARRRLFSVSAVAVLAAGVLLLAPDGGPELPPTSGETPLPVTTDAEGMLPDHLIRLRSELPDPAVPLATRELVLLYRIGDRYTGLFEGIFPHSCPIPTGADPCFSTALRREIEITGTDTTRGNDLMQVKAPENAEILYRGEPATGPIGIEAYNACSRIEVFEPYYRCIDGAPEYVVQEPERDHREVAAELEDVEALEAHLPRSFSVKRVIAYPGTGNVGRGSDTYYALIQVILDGPVDGARITFQIHESAAEAKDSYDDAPEKHGEMIIQGSRRNVRGCSGAPRDLECHGIFGHVQLRGQASGKSFAVSRRVAERLRVAAYSRVTEVYGNG